MARQLLGPSMRPYRFPHPRGDGPDYTGAAKIEEEISPPTWGWPAHQTSAPVLGFDFPTHVGMARDGQKNYRVRRDFPTHVGMARRADFGLVLTGRFPHPRGDGPACTESAFTACPISPPTWGWFGGSDGLKPGTTFSRSSGIGLGQYRLGRGDQTLRVGESRVQSPQYPISNIQYPISNIQYPIPNPQRFFLRSGSARRRKMRRARAWREKRYQGQGPRWSMRLGLSGGRETKPKFVLRRELMKRARVR
jgi:hypothetical protein